MGVRLGILLLIAVGVAVYVAMRPSVANSTPEIQDSAPLIDTDKDLAQLREEQVMLRDRSLPGTEPGEKPELDIQITGLDPTGKRNTIYFSISESHGFYVEHFELVFFHKATPDTDQYDSTVQIPHLINDFLEANGTLTGCVMPNPAELTPIQGDMGTVDNWGVELVRHGRARAKNPDPIPPVAREGICDR